MSFLNLKSKGVEVLIDPTTPEKVAVSLQNLSEEILLALTGSIDAVSSREDTELRIDFSESFTLFIKQRLEVSRMLVAHPEKDHWVGTLALTESHSRLMSDALRSRMGNSSPASVSVAIAVHKMERIDRTSNLALSF